MSRSRSGESVRWLFEVLFSAYCGLLIVTDEAGKEASRLLGWGYPQLLQFQLYLRRHAGIVLRPSVLDFVAWCCLLALIILVWLRLAGRIAPLRIIVCYVTGVVAVSGFPLLWLRFSNQAASRWLLFEVGLIVVFIFLYRKWPANAVWRILVFTVHCAIWVFSTWLDPTFNAVAIDLLLFIGTTSVWSYYARLLVEAHSPVEVG